MRAYSPASLQSAHRVLEAVLETDVEVVPMARANLFAASLWECLAIFIALQKAPSKGAITVPSSISTALTRLSRVLVFDPSHCRSQIESRLCADGLHRHPRRRCHAKLTFIRKLALAEHPVL